MTLRPKYVLAPIILLASLRAGSAEAPKLLPGVLAYVRVQAPTVVLAHVRVVDGTGKPAVDNQNVVIEHGKILEEGSHAELLARQERYAQLFALQAQGYL